MAYRSRIVGHGSEDPEQLLANPRNFRIHPRAQEEALAGVLSEVGWVDEVLVNQTTGFVVDGHLRVAHAISQGEKSVPVTYLDLTEGEEGKVIASFDPITAMAVTDQEKLNELLAGMTTDDERLGEFLDSLRSESSATDLAEPRPSLADRFGVPPFSVLDARQGYWQDRKRQWLALGIQSELGRGESPSGLLGESEQARAHYASPGGSPRPGMRLGEDGKTVRGDGRGHVLYPSEGYVSSTGNDGKALRIHRSSDARAIKDHEWPATHLSRPQARLTWVPGHGPDDRLDEVSRKNLAAQPQSGTSIFDPVLCELVYRWFCPPGGHVLDPLAGGSVRGVVASRLGRSYTGVELRSEQIAANMDQLGLCDDPKPMWIEGDARRAGALAPGVYDLIFTCPPYADLERYSDDPRDLSTMDYSAFLIAYRAIIGASIGMLREDRFACVVVGDVRAPDGLYRNFVSDTIAAFRDAGAQLYNEAILVTAVGSLPIRVGKQFSVSRKLGKTHQNVLVFVKGDARRATEACGPVEVELPLIEEDAL